MSLKKSLKTRAITAFLFGALTIGLISVNQWTYFAFIGIVCCLCGLEWARLYYPANSSKYLALMLSILTLIPLPIFVLSDIGLKEALLIILIILVLFNLFFPKQTKTFMSSTGASILYITIPLIVAYKAGFHQGEYHLEYILFPLFLIWSNDVFAYLIGSLIGKRKLFLAVSPNKTWEGTIGGILVCTLIAILLGEFWMNIPWIKAGVFGLCVGILATIGDLFESSIKRSFDIKDSGSLLPGHGGFLDRFDSFLVVMPFAWIFWNYWL